jgi:hypothetical protein
MSDRKALYRGQNPVNQGDDIHKKETGRPDGRPAIKK